jgi:glycosyltransferase involved in cell wall biosynthesis
VIDLVCIVPVYNKEKLTSSLTLTSLLNSVLKLPKDFKLFIYIWNNGPSAIECDIEIKNVASEVNQYCTNASLAYVYNRVIESIDSKYYMVLDDDSEITSDVIMDFYHSVFKNDVELLSLPRICCNNHIISPLRDRTKEKLDSGVRPSLGFRAIGSGLIIPKGVIRKMGGNIFDEKLTLYGVDTVFCYDYQSRCDSIFVLRSTLKHNVAGMSTQSVKSFMFRESNLVDSLIYMFINGKGSRITNLRRMAQTIIKAVIVSKEIEIIKVAMRSIKKRYNETRN